MAPIMVSTQYLVISASAPASPSQMSGLPAPLLERVEISEHEQRQGDELQQIGVVLEALEIEDRIERDHHHDQERAARHRPRASATSQQITMPTLTVAIASA